ncbi:MULTISPECIES: hypothetical protein [unclassified Hyphomicrobium]|uniref:hypothetical protein n=1 Tax=unclassified Hyphomicrobium TaxID=2619925 RepID=UPI000213EDB7|nr:MULTISPECIES: hypothetical protein [unclassified Hyphomicrobium]CCB67239.1 protein of unknown function [Hyphomicrobium sp. MC1]
MTLDELQRNERLLMRLAFERACAIAGLSLNVDELLDDGAYARVAAAVQIQVERGVSDLDVIAGNAAVAMAENDSGSFARAGD